MAQTFKKLTINGGGVNDTFIAPQIAEDFSTSKTYSAGNYCTYQGVVYKFTAAKTAGAWDAAKVTAVNVADGVGDLKSALSSAAESSMVEIPYSRRFVSGGLSTTSGGNTTSTTRIRSSDYNVISTKARLSVDPGYKFMLYIYTGLSISTYLGVFDGVNTEKRAAWITSDLFIGSINPEYQYKIVIGKIDDSDIEPSEGEHFHIYVPTDTSFTLRKPADAKATGDRLTALENSINSRPTKIRVMQYNVGNFCMGGKLSDSYRYLTTANYAVVMDNYKRVLGDVQADIIGFEEFEDSMTIIGVDGAEDVDVSFNEVLFDRLYPQGYDDTYLDITSFKAVKIKHGLIGATRKTITKSYTYEGQSYSITIHPIYGHFAIDGKTVGFVVNAFPNTDSSLPTEQNRMRRKTAYSAVVELLENDEYAFIICDANANPNMTTILMDEILIPAGYNSAMGSYFPWQMTYQSRTTSEQQSIDNIFYKADRILLSNYKVLWDERPNLASDHVPIYADFILL